MTWQIFLGLLGASGVGAAGALARHALLHGWQATLAFVIRVLRALVAPVPVLGPLCAAHTGRHTGSYVRAYDEAGTTQEFVPAEVVADLQVAA